MGEKDLSEKSLEAYNDVFSDIVNGFLFHGRPVVLEHLLEDASPLSVYKAEGKLREEERDVEKYWMENSRRTIRFRIACFGIENQSTIDRDMPLRVIGYDGAAYRAQLLQDRKERYPVITLVLYFGKQRWRKYRSLHQVLKLPEELRPYTPDYPINLFEVAYLTEEQLSYFHSDFRIVADYFVHSRKNPHYRPKNPEAFRHVDELLKMMAVFTQDERFVTTLSPERKGGKPKNMCELLDYVEKEGFEKGLKEGRKQSQSVLAQVESEGYEKGLKEGREEGIEKGKLLTLIQLVRDQVISLEQGAKNAGLSLAEFRAFML